MSTTKIARTPKKSKALETAGPERALQAAQDAAAPPRREDEGPRADRHPDDIRSHFRDARDASARALALLVYIDKLRREDDDERNGEMIGWLTQDVHDALGEAHHAACTGLLNSGAAHEYEDAAEALRDAGGA